MATLFVLILISIIMVKWCNRRWGNQRPMLYAMVKYKEKQWKDIRQRERLEAKAMKAEDTAPRSGV